MIPDEESNTTVKRIRYLNTTSTQKNFWAPFLLESLFYNEDFL